MERGSSGHKSPEVYEIEGEWVLVWL